MVVPTVQDVRRGLHAGLTVVNNNKVVQRLLVSHGSLIKTSIRIKSLLVLLWKGFFSNHVAFELNFGSNSNKLVETADQNLDVVVREIFTSMLRSKTHESLWSLHL